MIRFVLFFFISFACLNPTTWAEGFDSDFHWGEMHYYAQSRSEWHKKAWKKLTDESFDFEERLAFAKRFTGRDESEVGIKEGLSAKTKQKFQSLKYLNAVLSDVIYSSLFWDFLERTFAFYCKAPHNDPETRKEVLPYLARELKNFDEYTTGDLKSYSDIKYYNKEFFIARTIFEECEVLAKHYNIEIDPLNQIIDEKTHESVSLSEVRGQRINFKCEQIRTSNKPPYFMEQLLYHRKHKSAREDQLPDRKEAPFQVFQTYILPATGPTLIEEIERAIIEQESESSGKKPVKSKAEKKKKHKKGEKKKRKKTHQKKKLPKTHKKDLAQKEKAVESRTPFPITQVLEGTYIEDESIEKDQPTWADIVKKQGEISQEEISTSPPKLALSDIGFHIEKRGTTSYSFKGEIFSPPYFQQSETRITDPLLKDLKEMSTKDKVPNLATGFITFHYQVGGEDKHTTRELEGLFLSGSKCFKKEELEFKKTHGIVTAMQEILDKKERKSIFRSNSRLERVPLGIIMEKKLRQKIIRGSWQSNCLDSEAVLLLQLETKLPAILRDLISDNSEQPLLMQGIVLGISSYRDCCPNCQKLIQGYQWGLKNTLSSFRFPQLTLDEDFGTLAITYGHTRLEKCSYARLRYHEDPAKLDSQQHKFICSEYP